MKIERITVITNRHGADIVVLHTDLPSPMPFVTNQNASLMMHVEAGKGNDYAKQNFPDVPMEKIES